MTVNVELMLACDLKADVPQQVIETLRYLTRKEDYEFNNPPDHPFFAPASTYIGHEWWRNIFQPQEPPEFGPILGYFPGVWIKEFYRNEYNRTSHLTVRIETGYSAVVDTYYPFLDWLAPYIDTENYDEFIGYFRAENAYRTAAPALLYCNNGRIFFSETTFSPAEMNEANLRYFFFGPNLEENKVDKEVVMKIERLDHIVLTVQNIEKSVQFYTRVLGMTDVKFGAGRRAVHFGQQKINLQEVGKEAPLRAMQPTPGSGDVCFITNVPLEQVIEHVRSCGVEIEAGPVAREGALGQMESVYIRDPDANLIEISNYKE